ncbi:hypothetical protein EYF80_050130 [Liparis tanakae]|uniref:Uncharacterized protein n=1 Tax=Liparis tanakae TaxID=230148 RepID=A0A4Z2FEM0_9TELE|nr:hypothetical protein EYF80_050130 [Liparis tanakae]
MGTLCREVLVASLMGTLCREVLVASLMGTLCREASAVSCSRPSSGRVPGRRVVVFPAVEWSCSRPSSGRVPGRRVSCSRPSSVVFPAVEWSVPGWLQQARSSAALFMLPGAALHVVVVQGGS